jgi:hypothetical protein
MSLVEIISIPGVMTREIIKQYEDKRVYAPAEELQKATEKRNVVPIVMFRDREHSDLDPPDHEIIGWAGLRYEDGKVKVKMAFIQELMNEDQLEMLAHLEKDNLSPAFLATREEKKGAFNGKPYDEIQRDFDWRHIAVVSKGRCSDRDGCGLYKDTFDSIDSSLSDCVARKIPIFKSEHPDWTHEHVVAAAYGYCREHTDVMNPMQTGSGSDSDIKNADQIKISERDDSMSDELAQLKAQLAEQDAQITAFKARELETLRKAVVEHIGVKEDLVKDATKDALELLLKLPKKEAGQDTSEQTDGSEEQKEVKDAAWEPGLTLTVGYDYAKGFGNKSAAIRKKVG